MKNAWLLRPDIGMISLFFERLASRLLFSALLIVSSDVVARESVVDRIAFGSCALQSEPQPIWKEVLEAKPDLFLLIGDNIYGDTEDMAVMRAKYAQFDAQPGFAKLRRKMPLLATWDDHDFGRNNAGVEFPRKFQSQQVFLDFMREPLTSPRRQQEGVYSAKTFGPAGKRVQIILLDTRYFRSPVIEDRSPNRTMPNKPDMNPESTILGKAQWRWLEEQLRQPAEVRLLVSSIQVVPQNHGGEKWMNFPLERERLFKLIRDTKANGVIILSGDRHFAELSVMDGGVGYPIFDLTSSGLNRGRKEWRWLEPNQHRVQTMNVGDNFGLIEIDWKKEDPRLSLQIRDIEGDVMIQQKLPLSLLQAREKK